jgi:replicative DNA helicase
VIDTENAEGKLVGICLLAPDQVPSIMGMVSAEEFGSPIPRSAFKAICDRALDGGVITVNTIEKLSGVPKKVLGSYLDGVQKEEWDFYAKQVSDGYKLRWIAETAQKLINLSESTLEPTEALARAQGLLSEEGRATFAMESIDEAIDTVMSKLGRMASGFQEIGGLETGWGWLDRVLDGLQGGRVFTVYAPTSQFKSLFVQNIAWFLSSHGTPGLMFTTEMPRDQVVQRLLQLETGLNIKGLRYDGVLSQHMHVLKDGAEAIRTYPLWVCDQSVLDIKFVQSLCSRAKKNHDIKYVVIDLIDHVWASRYGDDAVKSESYIMQQMKELAKRLDVAVILTTHIKKADFDQRRMQRPVLDIEEMKGSSSKGQDADVALSIVQVELDDQGKWRSANRDERIAASKAQLAHIMVGITKNRDGELADIPFEVRLWEGGRMHIQRDPQKAAQQGTLA